jgi:ribonuclease HIII
VRQSNLFGDARGHMGTDESGKGDYFGPLVAAGVYVPDGQEAVLRECGIRDSKRVSDNRVRELAEIIMQGYTHSIVAIGPEKYNELYSKFRNLNRLLAWAHSRVIENILQEVPCTRVITDQFGDKLFVENALMKRGRSIELVQKHRAEEDIAVAAASILARSEFLRRLFSLSQEADMELPKGASPLVEEAGAALVRRYGPQVLTRFAKTHFKTNGRVLAAVQTSG